MQKANKAMLKPWRRGQSVIPIQFKNERTAPTKAEQIYIKALVLNVDIMILKIMGRI